MTEKFLTSENNHRLRDSRHEEVRLHEVFADARQHQAEEHPGPAQQRQNHDHDEERSVVLGLEDEPDEDDDLNELDHEDQRVDHDVRDHHLRRLHAGQKRSVPKSLLAIVDEHSDGQAGSDVKHHQHDHRRRHRLLEVRLVRSIDRLEELDGHVV